MYIKYRNNPKIIAASNITSKGSREESLIPEIVSEEIVYDDQGNVDSHMYNIRFFCPVHIRNWLASAGSKIELKLSNLSAADHRKLAKQNLADLLQEKSRTGELSSGSPQGSKGNAITDMQESLSEQVNQAMAMLTSTVSAYTSQSLFDNALTVTSFNFLEFEKKILNSKTEKFIEFKKAPTRKRNLGAELAIQKLQETFRKKHNYLISQGVDPMFLFENSYKKTSTLLNNAGLKTEEPLKLNCYEKFLKEIF